MRTLRERLAAEIDKLGAYDEKAPKKTYISMRRNKQSAMFGPTTEDQIEPGFNARALPAAERLKAMLPGGMCQNAVRLSSVSEVDAQLMRWIRTAFDAAG